MADDAAKVRVGVTGEIYKATAGTTLPTNALSTPAAGFTSGLLGYISEDGVKMTVSTDVTEIKAWQNATVVRKIQTGSDVSFGFTGIELNPVSLAAAFGNYTTVDTLSGSAQITGNALPTLPWLIDVVDGLARVRIVIPFGQASLDGDIPIGGTDPISLPFALSAFPDSAGVKAYLYVDHDATVSG